ncbi:MAG TPA: hypothetical protein VIY73_16410, partial [Polyangiaceae bacterium]
EQRSARGDLLAWFASPKETTAMFRAQLEASLKIPPYADYVGALLLVITTANAVLQVQAAAFGWLDSSLSDAINKCAQVERGLRACDDKFGAAVLPGASAPLRDDSARGRALRLLDALDEAGFRAQHLCNAAHARISELEVRERDCDVRLSLLAREANAAYGELLRQMTPPGKSLAVSDTLLAEDARELDAKSMAKFTRLVQRVVDKLRRCDVASLQGAQLRVEKRTATTTAMQVEGEGGEDDGSAFGESFGIVFVGLQTVQSALLRNGGAGVPYHLARPGAPMTRKEAEAFAKDVSALADALAERLDTCGALSRDAADARITLEALRGFFRNRDVVGPWALPAIKEKKKNKQAGESLAELARDVSDDQREIMRIASEDGGAQVEWLRSRTADLKAFGDRAVALGIADRDSLPEALQSDVANPEGVSQLRQRVEAGLRGMRDVALAPRPSPLLAPGGGGGGGQAEKEDLKRLHDEVKRERALLEKDRAAAA